MKTKLIISLTLLCVIGAGIASATIQQAVTSDYNEQTGKKLIFYGDGTGFDVITKFYIKYWNYHNTSEKHEETVLSLNTSSYEYTIKPTSLWNATYIQWEVVIWDSFGNLTRFEGGFSLLGPVPITFDLTSELENSTDNLKDWFLNNDDFQQKFDNLDSSIVSQIDEKISSYNEGLVTQLKEVGLTNNQINSIMESINDGFIDTLKDRDEQIQDVLDARNEGFNNGIRTTAIFIFICLAILIYSLHYKGYIKLSAFKSIKKPKVTQTDDLDIFS